MGRRGAGGHFSHSLHSLLNLSSVFSNREEKRAENGKRDKLQQRLHLEEKDFIANMMFYQINISIYYIFGWI